MLLCSHELLVVQSPQSRRLRQPAIGEQLAFMSTRPEHSQGEEGMLNLLLGITALLATTSLTQAQTPIERGSYLVNGVLTCGNCHTPRGPGGIFAMDRQLSGGPQEWDRPTYKVRGANITPDKETGIGNAPSRGASAKTGPSLSRRW